MNTYYDSASDMAAYALGQRRGFFLGVVCGAMLVIYSQNYLRMSRFSRYAARNQPLPK